MATTKYRDAVRIQWVQSAASAITDHGTVMRSGEPMIGRRFVVQGPYRVRVGKDYALRYRVWGERADGGTWIPYRDLAMTKTRGKARSIALAAARELYAFLPVPDAVQS